MKSYQKQKNFQQQQSPQSQSQQMPINQKDKLNHKKTLIQIIILGTYFLLLTLTYTSFATIITYIYQHHEGYSYLGPLLLLANNGVFMLVNIFAPYIKIKYKKQFVAAAICYSLNYALEIPNRLDGLGIFLLIVGAMLGGFGAAIVWVSQGGFMSALFQKYQIPHHYKGRYFGMLNMIVYSNIFVGSLVTTFGLGYLGFTEYFIILTCIGVLSMIFSLVFIEDVQQQNKSQNKFIDQDEQLRTKDQIKLETKNKSSSIIFYENMNITKSLKEIYRFAVRMKYYIPMIITDGFILGFISASSTHLLPSYSTKIHAGIFLVFQGFGAICGGFLSGYLSDKYRIMQVGKTTFLVLSLGLIFSVPVIFSFIQSYNYSLFLGFVWGFIWHYMDGWLWVSCSKIFQGKLESFALNKFIHSGSFGLYQLALILCGSQNPLLFIERFFVVLLILMIISFIFLLKQSNKNAGLSTSQV